MREGTYSAGACATLLPIRYYVGRYVRNTLDHERVFIHGL